jgi:hypothetical protein
MMSSTAKKVHYRIEARGKVDMMLSVTNLLLSGINSLIEKAETHITGVLILK